ncbi:MAG: diaminopimelate dehydrogenase [Tannerella sp.]|jgi:diaminopimelate dehydrogenase|nr:diaminopimelate dehydrogenase [Tannerella sp.]
MQKIKAAIVGFGNVGKYVLEALEASFDFEVAGIVSDVPVNIQTYPVVEHIASLPKPDVAILATPTRLVEQIAGEALELGINTVDGFDIHNQIVSLRYTLDRKAKKYNAVSIIAAGWDPGSDSVVRALFEAIAPRGITYTNFGPGMSMGHTVAVKAIEGVKAALSMTIPLGTGIHRRIVYVEIAEGYEFEQVADAIRRDGYFKHDETHVVQTDNIDNLLDMGHGVNMVRKGVSGKAQNQLFEFNMKINNPALTGQVLVAAARASIRQQPGAYTLIEIPVIDLLYGEKENLISRFV